MAVREVIYFRFGAQLSTRRLFPALSPPEPVAESPPDRKPLRVSLAFGRISIDTPFVRLD